MPDEVCFPVRYEAGHVYNETWKKTKYHCPCCGIKDVWQKPDGGDYYQGESFLCVTCKAHWNWPAEPFDQDDWQSRQRIDAIRSQGMPNLDEVVNA